MNIIAKISIVVVFITSCLSASIDLPGIFSASICSNDTIREKLSPLCACKERVPFTDLMSLCRQNENFIECMKTEMQGSQYNNSFTTHVFSGVRLQEKLRELCNNTKDGAVTSQCSSFEKTMSCQDMFLEQIQNNSNPNEQHSCQIVNKLEECYWDVMNTSCPVQVRYFWRRLAGSFISNQCSNYSKSVDLMCNCIQQEQLESIHHGDRWQNVEFDLQRYRKFQVFRCKLWKGRQAQCDKQNIGVFKPCGEAYERKVNEQIQIFQRGNNVSIEEICRVNEEFSECIQKSLSSCSKENFFFHIASICGNMPTSCKCLIDINKAGTDMRIASAIKWVILCVIIAMAINLNC